MPASRLFRLSVLTSCLAFLAVALNGCLQAKDAVIGRYDADKDQFVFLNIYQGIHGEKPGDLAYLVKLWDNRDHLITPPLPQILGKTSYLRISAHQAASLNLGQPGLADATDCPLPLDQITVLPGQFFVRSKDALCYYDQIVVPGSFVDETMKLFDKAGAEAATQILADERDRRSKGGKRASWDDFRKLILPGAEVHASAEVSPAPATTQSDQSSKSQFLSMLSDASLKKIEAQLAKGSVGVSRDKAIFREMIELDENDAKEALATFAAFQKAVAEELKKPDHDASLEKLASLLSAVKASSPRAGVIEFSVDAVDFFARVEAIYDPKAELPDTAEKDPAAKEAIFALKEKNIPIDDKTTIDQILNDFHAGKLAGHPSEKPVPPGEGLIEKK